MPIVVSSPQSNNLYPVSGCGLLGWSPFAAKGGFFDEGVVATLTQERWLVHLSRHLLSEQIQRRLKIF